MKDNPKISLIMTLLNEERGLGPFLQSLSNQTRLPDEVVVVDGGSTDNTVSILKAWGEAANRPVRVFVEPGANISEGRNSAIGKASHDVIAVTDAGTLLDPGWLEALAVRLGPEVDVVAGFFEPMWTTRTEQVLATIITPTIDEIDPATFLPSSRSLLIRRHAWESAGGYPEWLDYCEDLVFDIAMKRAGMRFRFAGDAIARWSARPSMRAYAKQYYRYARGDGKADLWRRRHALRYGAYGLGITGAIAGTRAQRVALGGGFVVYSWRFLKRAWARRPERPSEAASLFLATPLVVVVGDLAKMAGYPAGLAWRRRVRPPGSA